MDGWTREVPISSQGRWGFFGGDGACNGDRRGGTALSGTGLDLDGDGGGGKRKRKGANGMEWDEGEGHNPSANGTIPSLVRTRRARAGGPDWQQLQEARSSHLPGQ